MTDTAYCYRCGGTRPIDDETKMRVLDDLPDGRVISEWKIVMDCGHSGNVVRV